MPKVRPRDAASLILHDQGEGQIRLLMGRRAGGHRFMPNVWVFPGGRIERADYHVPVAADLPEEELQALGETARSSRQNGARLARALALAGVRETYEETGLVLGKKTRPMQGPGGWNEFCAQGYQPDLSGIRYLFRAITPTGYPQRFDARFLLASADTLASKEPQDSHELEAVSWFTLEECFKLELALITKVLLSKLQEAFEGKLQTPAMLFDPKSSQVVAAKRSTAAVGPETISRSDICTTVSGVA